MEWRKHHRRIKRIYLQNDIELKYQNPYCAENGTKQLLGQFSISMYVICKPFDFLDFMSINEIFRYWRKIVEE